MSTLQMKPSEILIAAKTVISDEANWTKGSFARDAEGVSLGDGYDNSAVCFCSLGAIEHVTKADIGDTPAITYLSIAAFDISLSTIEELNDHSSHAMVMQMWDLAIDLALEDENE